VRWQTVFGTVPTAVNMMLQAAMSDAEYQIIDATTAATGEGRTVFNVQAFCQFATGGAGLTAKILV
jgi:hypothetical protein